MTTITPQRRTMSNVSQSMFKMSLKQPLCTAGALCSESQLRISYLELEAQLHQKQRSFDDLSAQFRMEKSMWTEKNQILTERLVECKDSLDAVTARNKWIPAHDDEAEPTISLDDHSSDVERDELQQRLVSKDREIAALKNQLAENEKRQKHDRERVDRMSSTLSTQTTQYGWLRVRNEKLLSEIESLKQEVQSMTLSEEIRSARGHLRNNTSYRVPLSFGALDSRRHYAGKRSSVVCVVCFIYGMYWYDETDTCTDL